MSGIHAAAWRTMVFITAVFLLNNARAQNDVGQNQIVFTIRVANNYVTTNQPELQLNITAGTPNYYTVQVDNTNFQAGAYWTVYTAPAITVNLGATEGWHELWVGLKGPSADAPITWEWKRLKLDVTPPTFVITGPTNSTVDMPTIQLTGYSSEDLSRISYDLTNACGLVTNQQVLVLDQDYDRKTSEFTTNTFQAFEVPLTNGLNIITLHAIDRAGNVGTLTTNFTLDYSSKTNLPAVTLLWPVDGMEICGNNIVCRGQVTDPTVNVKVQLVDANGTTNSVGALVGRDGLFYANELVLADGTNHLSYTVTDVVGNVVTTNITVVTTDVPLTMNTVVAGQSLVTGTIGKPGYTIYVNGVMATIHGDGTWNATITPIGVGGGAVVVNAVKK